MGGVAFSDKVTIASDSIVEIAKGAKLFIGSNVAVNSGFRVSANEEIFIEDNVLISWDVSIMDSDFHYLTDVNTGTELKRNTRPIVIGRNTWIGFNATLLKGAITGSYNVIGSNSLLSKDFSNCKYTIIAGNPAVVKKQGYYLNRN